MVRRKGDLWGYINHFKRWDFFPDHFWEWYIRRSLNSTPKLAWLICPPASSLVKSRSGDSYLMLVTFYENAFVPFQSGPSDDTQHRWWLRKDVKLQMLEWDTLGLWLYTEQKLKHLGRKPPQTLGGVVGHCFRMASGDLSRNIPIQLSWAAKNTMNLTNCYVFHPRPESLDHKTARDSPTSSWPFHKHL